MKEQLYFTIVHKWKYLFAILKSHFYSRSKTVKKVVYIAREKDKDWIFGAKVRRLSRYSALDATVHYHNKLRNFPKADGYFFIYQNYFCRSIRSNPSILKKRNVVMFTHPNWSRKYSKTHVVWCLNKADVIICLNSNIKVYLIACGVKADLLQVLHIGTSSSFFHPHERGQGDIGFCSAFHVRKNPDLILNIIKHMPDKTFHLIGRHWERYERFEELNALSNLIHHDAMPYESYPDLYSQLDVFVSTSLLEGGPVPILEAMMSNCVPVASKTGFAEDVIEDGTNGYLFDLEASHETVIPLIEKALKLKGDMRPYVMPYTWQNCSKTIDSYFLS